MPHYTKVEILLVAVKHPLIRDRKPDIEYFSHAKLIYQSRTQFERLNKGQSRKYTTESILIMLVPKVLKYNGLGT